MREESTDEVGKIAETEAGAALGSWTWRNDIVATGARAGCTGALITRPIDVHPMKSAMWVVARGELGGTPLDVHVCVAGP